MQKRVKTKSCSTQKDRVVTCRQKRLKIKSLQNAMEVTCKQKRVNIKYNSFNQEHMVITSQVPQPTCYRKWVGCTIPLKQEFFTLEAS